MVFMAVFSFPLIPISFLFFFCTLPVNTSYKQDMQNQKDVLLRYYSQYHCLLWKKSCRFVSGTLQRKTENGKITLLLYSKQNNSFTY